LPQYTTIEDAADLLFNAENIVVVAGAGISTCVGIPDFRSAKGKARQLSHYPDTDPCRLVQPGGKQEKFPRSADVV
jgi:NAD+-dependent protein deacetylase SIR2